MQISEVRDQPPYCPLARRRSAGKDGANDDRQRPSALGAPIR
jgi:hypothetical protein